MLAMNCASSITEGNKMKQQYVIHLGDLDFLIANIREPALRSRLEQAKQNGPILAAGKYATGKIAVTLDEAEADLLVDLLSRLFSEIGLRPDSEPNSTGLKIEGLIDIFNRV
jgi:hypothetical protein